MSEYLEKIKLICNLELKILHNTTPQINASILEPEIIYNESINREIKNALRKLKIDRLENKISETEYNLEKESIENRVKQKSNGNSFKLNLSTICLNKLNNIRYKELYYLLIDEIKKLNITYSKKISENQYDNINLSNFEKIESISRKIIATNRYYDNIKCVNLRSSFKQSTLIFSEDLYEYYNYFNDLDINLNFIYEPSIKGNKIFSTIPNDKISIGFNVVINEKNNDIFYAKTNKVEDLHTVFNLI